MKPSKVANRLASQNGNGAEPTAPAPVGGIGRTGLKQWSGHIQEEFLKELQGARKYDVYREMSENDPIVGAMLRAIEYLIRGVVWRVEAEDPEDPAQVQVADHVDYCRLHMVRSWEEVLVEILSMLPFGFSFHELVYEQRPEGLCWRDWPIRAQESLYQWRFRQDAQRHDTDELVAFSQRPAPDFLERTIPLEKGLLFRVGSRKNDPEGRSMLRNAYLPWYYKNHLQRIEAIGIERDLAGYPVLYCPGEVLDNISSTAYLAAQKIVTNIRRDEQEGALLNSARDASGNMLWDLKLLATGGQRQFDTNAIIGRYDTRIAQSCLADFILIGHEKVGSFALASSKTDVFALALQAILDTICATVNRFAIPRLLELNGMATDTPPQLVHGDIELPDLQELGAYITALTGAGIPLFPDQKLENRLRELGGLPTLSTEEFDQREAQAEADKQMQMELQLEQAKATAQGANQKATEAQTQADATAKELHLMGSEVRRVLEVQKGTPPPPIHLTINGAPTTVTSSTPGAQTFNITTPKAEPAQVTLQQPITVHPAASPGVTVPVTVAAAKAADVHLHAPITVEAAPAVVVPAPQMITTVTPPDVQVHVAAPPPAVVNVQTPGVTVKNIVAAQPPAIPVVNVTLETAPIAEAIRQAAEQLTPPVEIVIERNAEGEATKLKPGGPT